MTDLRTLSWTGGVIGVEPLALPAFDEAPPDGDALAREVDEQLAAARERHGRAEAVQRRLGPLVRWSIVAIAAGGALAIALAIAIISGGPTSFYNGDADGAGYSVLGYALLACPLLGTLTFASWRKARDPRLRLSPRRFVLIVVGSGIAGAATYGALWVAFPVAMGLVALRGRPVLRWPNGSEYVVSPSTLEAYRTARSARADAHRIASDEATAAPRAVAAAESRYEERRRAHESRLAAMSPFEAVGPLADQDLLVVGGSPQERGDLVHNVVASWSNAGPVWILDLLADGTSTAAYEEAARQDRSTGIADASRAERIGAMVNELVDDDRGAAALVDVLSTAIATGSGTAVAARKREIADPLRRICAVLAATRDRVAAADLHEAMETLLAGRTAATRSAHDDFGLATRVEGGAQASPGLTANEMRAVREAFTDDERRAFLREWTEIRAALGTLLDHDGDQPAAITWSAGRDLRLAYVSADLSRDDRELRSAILVQHHLQVLRRRSDAPACLVVTGCDELDYDLLRDLSKVADASEVALVLVFADLTPQLRQLARGRRALAAFGGLGAEAAEELSNAFGHAWSERVQSYQATWSQSLAESRSRTSGRNWGGSESVTRTSGSTSGSTSGYSTGGSSESGSSSSGTSSSTTRSTSHTDSETWGENESSTDGDTTTDTESAATTRSIQYEQAVRGSAISQLPPYTLLLKVGAAVRPLDVNGELVLPDTFLSTFEPLHPRRHRALRTRTDDATGLPRLEPAHAR